LLPNQNLAVQLFLTIFGNYFNSRENISQSKPDIPIQEAAQCLIERGLKGIPDISE